MVMILAHFDGRVLVPEAPVDLPRGRVLQVHVNEMEDAPANGSTTDITECNGFPVFKVKHDARKITSDDVRRDEDER